MSKVVWIFECPMNSCTAFAFAPESIRREAKVCRASVATPRGSQIRRRRLDALEEQAAGVRAGAGV
ncbi:MAG: hypothetical protein ACXWFH_11100, partial [Solirubrobacterales bacterium]